MNNSMLGGGGSDYHGYLNYKFWYGRLLTTIMISWYFIGVLYSLSLDDWRSQHSWSFGPVKNSFPTSSRIALSESVSVRVLCMFACVCLCVYVCVCLCMFACVRVCLEIRAGGLQCVHLMVFISTFSHHSDIGQSEGQTIYRVAQIKGIKEGQVCSLLGPT